MKGKQIAPFNPQTFLKQVGSGKTTLTSPKKQILFSQGDASDAVFYIQTGKIKLSVVSQQGKEAVIAILEKGSFSGKGVSPGSWCAWPRRPPRKTPLSCALKKPR